MEETERWQNAKSPSYWVYAVAIIGDSFTEPGRGVFFPYIKFCENLNRFLSFKPLTILGGRCDNRVHR